MCAYLWSLQCFLDPSYVKSIDGKRKDDDNDGDVISGTDKIRKHDNDVTSGMYNYICS